MKLRIFGILGAGLLAGLLLLKVAAGNSKGLLRKEAEETSYAVRVQRIQPVEFRPGIEALAEVIATINPRLAAEVSGKILWIHPELQVGYCAQPEEVLIRLESQDFELSLERVRAQIEALNQELLNLAIQENELKEGVDLGESSLEAAERELKRQQELVAENSAAEGSVDPLIRSRNSIKNQLVQQKSARARIPHTRAGVTAEIKALGAQKAQLQLDLSRSRLSFEEKACVSSRQVEVGQRVQPGQILLEALNPAELKMIARYPEFVSRKADGPSRGWEVIMEGRRVGRVLSVSPGLNPLTRAREAAIEIQTDVLAGRLVRVHLVGPPREVLVVPASLVQHSRVLVLDQNQRIAEKKVRTGAEDQKKRVEILSGLEAGDIVIAEARAAAPVGALAHIAGERK